MDVVWLLIAIETGKFDETLKTSLFDTRQECIDATFETRTKSVMRGFGPFTFFTQDGEYQYQYPEWSCIPMVKPPEGFDIVEGHQ